MSHTLPYPTQYILRHFNGQDFEMISLWQACEKCQKLFETISGNVFHFVMGGRMNSDGWTNEF